jgi:hypothetical protein
MVIGSRYLPPAKSADDDFMTSFGNWAVHPRPSTCCTGTPEPPYTDAMVIYRIYPTRLFRELETGQAGRLRHREMVRTLLGVEPLLSVRAAKRKLRIAVIPVDEPARNRRRAQAAAFPLGGRLHGPDLREIWFWK